MTRRSARTSSSSANASTHKSERRTSRHNHVAGGWYSGSSRKCWELMPAGRADAHIVREVGGVEGMVVPRRNVEGDEIADALRSETSRVQGRAGVQVRPVIAHPADRNAGTRGCTAGAQELPALIMILVAPQLASLRRALRAPQLPRGHQARPPIHPCHLLTSFLMHAPQHGGDLLIVFIKPRLPKRQAFKLQVPHSRKRGTERPESSLLRPLARTLT